ncbi:MAG TPA: hypothetical protein VFG72_12955 [Marmoricola sp.]|nr:hypothetical protein [Marmoricola sp.]
MTYRRLPYDDAATTTEMVSDCAAVERVLDLSVEHVGPADTPFDRQGRDEIVVPDSLADLARKMQLHFD